MIGEQPNGGVTHVTLVGHDGHVTVPKIHLKGVFEAMVTSGSQINETLTVNLDDFDRTTIQTFVHFLRTEQLGQDIDKETLMGLFLLGNKYGLKNLETKSKVLITALINDFVRSQTL